MAEKMSEREFIAVLQSEERGAVGYRSTEIAEEQEKALRYYNGEAFGNEEEGRSQVVSRDVSSTIDGIMPDLLKLFVSGDDVVKFEPEKPEDDDFADQATDYANFIFFKDNDGYTITHDWAKDGLLHKIGVVKCYWDDSEKKVRETYDDLDEDALVALAQDAEIIEATPDEDGTTVTVIRKEQRGRVVIENVPPEEFLLAPRTRTLKDAYYCAHKVRKTISELIAMGFPREKVVGLADHDDGDTYDTREQERYKDENYINKEEGTLDPMMRQVWMLEEYIRSDYDGDGLAELRKVTRVNKTILENLEVDEHPFADWGPNRMPHKVIGRSEADSTMDIQLVKSTLLRQALDNLYMSNNPRIEVPDNYANENTYDDLLTVRPAGIVRTKGTGGLTPLTVPFTAGHSFNMLEYWDGEREQRTGVTQYNQGLAPGSLNDGWQKTELLQNKGMGKIELKARNLANGFATLFEKILHLIVKYQDKERIVKLRGKWVPMSPATWNAEMRVGVQVGLGTGDRSNRVKARGYLLELQQQAMQMGLAEPEHLYNNVSALVKDMELGDASKYFANPENGQQERPDPEMMAKQAEMQMKSQEAQAQFQMKQQEMQAKMQMEQQKIEMQNQQKIEQINTESQLKLEQMNIEAQLKREQMAAEAQLKREQMEMEASLKVRGQDIQISDVRPGGEVG